MKDSLARLFAWKLGLYQVSPVGTARLVSAGYSKPTRYAKGTVAAIPTISSHQMVNYTSCPGVYLQRQLPGIRALAARYAHVVIRPPTPTVTSVQSGSASCVALTSSADRAVTWRADIFGPCSTEPVRSFTGRTKKAATIPMRWDLRNSSGRALLPAAYTLRMSGTAKDGSIVLPVYAKILITPAPGGAWGPCANVTRLAGGDAAATSVLWGRVSAPASRTVVLTAPADEGETALAAGVVAGPLARHLRAPLLLTPKAGLAPAVATDLRARKATRVIIVGSTSVVPQAVAGAVQRLGVSGDPAVRLIRSGDGRGGRAAVRPRHAGGARVAELAGALARGSRPGRNPEQSRPPGRRHQHLQGHSEGPGDPAHRDRGGDAVADLRDRPGRAARAGDLDPADRPRRHDRLHRHRHGGPRHGAARRGAAGRHGGLGRCAVGSRVRSAAAVHRHRVTSRRGGALPGRAPRAARRADPGGQGPAVRRRPRRHQPPALGAALGAQPDEPSRPSSSVARMRSRSR